MSAVKNKNNIKMWTTNNHKQKTISLFRSPLSALALMMGLMQSDSNFTDRIVKYLAKWAERKTKPASPSRGHVIPPFILFYLLLH